MITLLRSLAWFLSPRPMCTLCGEKHRNMDLHLHVDHADGT